MIFMICFKIEIERSVQQNLVFCNLFSLMERCSVYLYNGIRKTTPKFSYSNLFTNSWKMCRFLIFLNTFIYVMYFWYFSATEFWEKLTFPSPTKPMPRAQTTAFILSEFKTRGAVHYMGLGEQDYCGSQPDPEKRAIITKNHQNAKVRLNFNEICSGHTVKTVILTWMIAWF